MLLLSAKVYGTGHLVMAFGLCAVAYLWTDSVGEFAITTAIIAANVAMVIVHRRVYVILATPEPARDE